MYKVIIFVISLNIIFVSCSPVGSNWDQSSHLSGNNLYGQYGKNEEHTHQETGTTEPAITPEGSVATVQQQPVKPVSYLPTFIQAWLPQVVSQTIAQLAAHLPGFHRMGVYPQQNLGLVYPSLFTVYPANMGPVLNQGQDGMIHQHMPPLQMVPYGMYR